MSWARADQVAYDDRPGAGHALVRSDWRANRSLWHEAGPADHVCVSPPVRSVVGARYASAWDRRERHPHSFEWPSFTSDGGRFKGWLTLELARDGEFTFRGLFHNRAEASQEYSAVCAVPTVDGRLLLFCTSGAVPGEAAAALGADNWRRWDLSGTSTDVKHHWPAIAPGTQPRGTVSNRRCVSSMIKDLQAAEKSASGVCQIVSWLA